MSIDILLPALKEIVMFNSFESFLYLSVFVLLLSLLNKVLFNFKLSNNNNNVKISKKEFIFHISMLSILNYVLSNCFNVGGLIQFVNILGIVLYISVALKINIFKSIVVNFISFVFLFVMEMSLGVIYQNLFHINFLSMENDIKKFLSLLSIRAIEIFIIYILYKLKKRGEFSYEKNI